MLDPCRAFPNVMERLQRVSALKADGIRWFICPAHEDRQASGWAFVHPQSKMLVLKCFKGCRQMLIMRSIGVARKDIHMDAKRELRWVKHAHYDYRYLDGKIAFRVVRFHGMHGDERVAKRFVQQRPVGSNKWADNVDGVVRPLYRLPEMVWELDASEQQRLIWFTEGEGKCDQLRQLGLIATTLAGGCNAVLEPHQSGCLAGRRLVLCLDNDEYGRRWAERLLMAFTLAERRPKSITIMPFADMPRHGDVGDWIKKRQEAGEAYEVIRDELLWQAGRIRSVQL